MKKKKGAGNDAPALRLLRFSGKGRKHLLRVRSDLEPVVKFANNMRRDTYIQGEFRRGNAVLLENVKMTDHSERHADTVDTKVQVFILALEALRPGMFTAFMVLVLRIAAYLHDIGMPYGKALHALRGATDMALYLAAKCFPKDVLDLICWLIRNHRSDDFKHARQEIKNPMWRILLAMLVAADKSVECMERVHQDVRLEFAKILQRKPADWTGSLFGWLST
jgi:hypothetical protein